MAKTYFINGLNEKEFKLEDETIKIIVEFKKAFKSVNLSVYSYEEENIIVEAKGYVVCLFFLLEKENGLYCFSEKTKRRIQDLINNENEWFNILDF